MCLYWLLGKFSDAPGGAAATASRGGAGRIAHELLGGQSAGSGRVRAAMIQGPACRCSGRRDWCAAGPDICMCVCE